jgi:GPH family glycoside/pentoside/hexuronide:cation symporter
MVKGENIHNAYWLTFTLMCFFMGATAYIIPYNALLPELTQTGSERVKLSSLQQVGFVIGIILSAMVNNFADWVQHFAGITNRDTAVQYTIWGLAVFAGLVMLVPVFAIDEKRYSNGQPSHLSLLPAIKKTFQNRNFKYYLISDFSYYMALSIISSGLLFFLKCLLPYPKSMGGELNGSMVFSLLFYPLVNYLSKKIGKKTIVLFSFGLLSLIFVAIFFLGKFPFPPKAQIYTLVLKCFISRWPHWGYCPTPSLPK